ncbi:MAG TPA: hypothetical protein VL200_01060 [Lacunisphaera sp.]|jgi:hypothetical protein|nr:hypothetical protein [Lacunisphaera sp.]
MGVRDDYFLRFIALLRQAIAQMIKYRTTGRYTEALDAALQAQEKLFTRTTAELAKLDLAELIRLLRVDEPPETADEKVLIYGNLLRETGLVYLAMDRNDSAENCFQLALHVILTVACEQPQPSDEVRETLRDLLARIPPDHLHPPVLEMLERMGQRPS